MGIYVTASRLDSHVVAVFLSLPVASGSDKVKKGVDTVVAEARITLDPGLLGQNIIVLSFQISENLLEAVDYPAIDRKRTEQKAT